MSKPSATTIQLVLSNEKTGGRIIVGLEPFLEFDIDMTHRVQSLMERWSDRATAGGRFTANLPKDRF